MGIFGRLFGTGAVDKAVPEAVEYKGYRIRPAPYSADGQYQTAGTIEKDFPDGTREHRFVRAEKHAGKEEATAFALTKGMQIVDEAGDRMFDKR